jgi:hypothetical protein
MAWRSEDITITDSSLNLIDIRCQDDCDLALFVDGQPVIYDWGDGEGTVARYLLRAGAADFETALTSLRHVLDGNLDPDQTMESQLQVLLELFAPGHYQLTMKTLEPVPEYQEFSTSWDSTTDLNHYYPYNGSTLYTQPSDRLDHLRIEYFRRVITAGKRPIVILAGVTTGWSDFVIDGHHKLHAYRSRRIAPVVIFIARLDPHPINVGDLDSVLRNHNIREAHRKRSTF